MPFRILRTLFRRILGLFLPKRIIVNRVLDGDTFDGTTPDGKSHRVRIRGIDAPELTQPHGAEAKQALEELVKHETVVLKTRETDQYGRIVATVATPETANVGKTLAGQGDAWAAAPYAGVGLHLKQFQAKIGKKGLWANRNPEKPADHRRRKNSEEMEM